MPYKNLKPVLFSLILVLLALSSLPCAAQQASVTSPHPAELGNVSNATVTLYYYDIAAQSKGAIVNMTDNPQQVLMDPSKAAPGMYTFSHVPAGYWYYLEAENNGNKWYSIFYMPENVGTKTANVHIPPFQAQNDTVTPTSTPSPEVTVTAIPTPTTKAATPVPSPGMTFLLAIPGVVMTAIFTMKRL